MEPYDPNKPKVSFNIPSKESLIEAVLGLVPGGRAMYAEYKNPDISWKEYGDLVAEDVVPGYANVAKPLSKGEKPDWEAASKELAMQAFGLPVFLKKSGKAMLVKPRNMDELNKFNKAIDAGVAKGEITATDGAKFKQNALSSVLEDANLDKVIETGALDPSRIGSYVSPDMPPKEAVWPRQRAMYDDAIAHGNYLGKNLQAKPGFITEHGNNKFYIEGDQGKLLWNEHYKDAASVRHAGSNYNQVSPTVISSLARKYPGNRPGHVAAINVDGKYVNLYKTVAEPQSLKATGNKLGYNYIPALNRTINEGRAATKNDPKYKSVDEFYKIMLGIKE